MLEQAGAAEHHRPLEKVDSESLSVLQRAELGKQGLLSSSSSPTQSGHSATGSRPSTLEMDQLNRCSELVDGGQPDEGPYQTSTPVVTALHNRFSVFSQVSDSPQRLGNLLDFQAQSVTGLALT